MADGDCSLLMQCSDFELEPENKNGKCSADFLFIKAKEETAYSPELIDKKYKYCGADAKIRKSVNFGKWMMVRFKTNSVNNNFKGFKCHISCCSGKYLTGTQFELDYR